MDRPSFSCPCPASILYDIAKFEKNNQFEEAHQMFDQAINFYRQAFLRLQTEREKFRSRCAQKMGTAFRNQDNRSYLASQTVEGCSSSTCDLIHADTRPDHDIDCPIAIFQPLIPGQKLMYPKHLVYADGKDTQLEEIKWHLIQSNAIPSKQTIEIKNIAFNSSQHDDAATETQSLSTTILYAEENNSQLDKTYVLKLADENSDTGHEDHLQADKTHVLKPIENRLQPSSPFTPSKNLQKKTSSENKAETKTLNHDKIADLDDLKLADKNSDKGHEDHLQADKTYVLKPIENRLQPLSPFTPSKNLQKKTSSENKTEAKTLNLDKIADLDDKENHNPKTPILDDNDAEELNENDFMDDTYDTLSFSRSLVSSTPRSRMSLLFHKTSHQSHFERRNLNYVRKSVAAQPDPNLTMIVELSRERSISSGKENVNDSKTQIATELGKKNSVVNCQIDNVNGSKTRIATESEKKNSVVNCQIDLTDPFKEELIEHFLQTKRLNDKCSVDRFHRVARDLPSIKLSANLKLDNDKYTVVEELGKGNYGRVFKARIASKEVAIKIQKPACLWEFYISEEIRRRLQIFDKCQYFMHYWSIYMYNNGSALLSDCAAFGSLLDVVNSIKSSLGQPACPIIVATHATIQLMSIVEYLHSCKIIHGDLKPDNFVVTTPPSTAKPYLKLIDYGRSIDMTLFPDEHAFNVVVTTDDFTCHEMRDNKPWTYETDIFGLAATVYLLLIGDYMKTIKRDNVWVLKKQLPRYYREFWDPIFNILLNIPSRSQIPKLSKIKNDIKMEYTKKYDKYAIQEQFSRISHVFSRK